MYTELIERSVTKSNSLPEKMDQQVQTDALENKLEERQVSKDENQIVLPKWIFFIVIGGTSIFLIIVIVIACKCSKKKANSDAINKSLRKEPKPRAVNTRHGRPMIAKPINEWKSTKMTEKGHAKKSYDEDENEDLFDEGCDDRHSTMSRKTLNGEHLY